MNDFSDHIDQFPSWQTLCLSMALLTLAIMAAPPQRRLRWALAQLTLLTVVARLKELGEAAIICKVIGPAAILLVGVAAALHPGPRQRLSLANCLAIGVALVAVVMVSGAADLEKAVFLRGQFFLLAVAAALIARTIVDGPTLQEACWGFYLGVAAGTTLTMSALAVNPASAFALGLGRFQPYGCNPVQIGVLFVCAAPLSLYFALFLPRPWQRRACLAIGALACCGAVLTVSRMAMGGIALASLPCLLRFTRRPLTAAAFAVAATALAAHVMGSFEESNLRHLEAAQDSQRTAYMEEVLAEVAARPWAGLFTATNAYAHDEELNAHNSHIELAYLCGVVVAGASAALMATALYYAARLALRSGRVRYGWLLSQVLALLYLVTLINGMINFITNYPHYEFTVLHVCLMHFFLSEGVRRAAVAAYSQAPNDSKTASTAPTFSVSTPPRLAYARTCSKPRASF